MANITLRPTTNWSETLLHRFDMMLDRFELAARNLFTDKDGDFRQAAHAAQVRRLAAHGCSGQALI